MFDLFSPGIKLQDHKITSGASIEVMPVPKSVFIPFSQHQGKPANPLVKKGDLVKIGTKIGESDGFVSAPIHASISGRVIAIARHAHPVLGHAPACIIEANEYEEWEDGVRETQHYEKLSRAELLAQIKEAGIVGMGGGVFPTHVKLSPPEGKAIDTLIINGCECEPMLTSDYRLMLEYPVGIIEGAKIFQKIINATRIIFAVENNKIGVASVLEREGATVRAIRTRYPIGEERQLIKTILRRTIPRGGLPMDVGCVVHNVATCYAAFQALRFRKPLIERVVTVTGEGVKEPKNVLVRIGTPLLDLVNFCGGYTAKPRKIILGGPMMGIAQYSEEAPIIKCTTGVIVSLREKIGSETPCVRCARCIDVCPMGLMPCEIHKLVLSKQFVEASAYDIKECIECGCCAYSCPSKIPLVHYLKYGKAELQSLASR